MKALLTMIFHAWTEALDSWFASPGAVRMVPMGAEPYWFDVVYEGSRQPHYGRVLTLEARRLIG